MIYIKRRQVNNPKDPEGDELYIWGIVTVGTISLDVLAQRVAIRSGHSAGACLGVIEDALEAIVTFMESGYNVEMADFGRFQLKVASDGTEKPDLVSVANVKRKYVHYQPVGTLKQAFETITLKEAHDAEPVLGV